MKQTATLAVLATGPLACLAAFFAPAMRVVSPEIAWELFRGDGDVLLPPLGRSLCFALAATLGSIAFAVILALRLSERPEADKRRTEPFLVLLLVPFSLGSIGVAYLFKVGLSGGDFLGYLTRNPWSQYALLALVYIWRFGTLFCYVFYLRLQGIPKHIAEYGKVSLVGANAFRADFALRRLSALVPVLAVIGFLIAFYEDSLGQHVLRASRGTGTEMVAHWLQRTHQKLLIMDPLNANAAMSFIGIATAAIAVAGSALTALAGRFIFLKVAGILRYLPGRQDLVSSLGSYRFKDVFSVALLVFLPFVFLLGQDISFEAPGSLFKTFALAMFAGVLATTTCMASAAALRLLFPRLLSQVSERSMLFIAGVASGLALPPLLVVIAGFSWMGLFEVPGSTFGICLWVLGQVFLSLPMLASFMIALHFDVSRHQVEYFEVSGERLSEIIRGQFFLCFRTEYFFCFLVAFALIWNDSTVARALSDFVPSFSSQMERLYIGRGSDYSAAGGYLAISLLVSFSLVACWVAVVLQRSRRG